MANDSRQLMIDTAVRMFQERGYSGTSWRGLVAESGAPWGSVQHHFPGGKEELGAATIAAGGDAVLASLRGALEREATTAAAVRLWFARAARGLERSDFRGGCPVATVALETASESETMRVASVAAFESWIDHLAVALQADGIDRAGARRLATRVVEGFEGALLLARIRRSVRSLHDAADDHAAQVEAALGGG